LIVVDNNSRDSTATLVQSFAQHAPFAVRYVFESAQGLTRARNRGIAEAKGDVIVFTDDDVTVEPNWLERLSRVFDDPNCMAAGGKIVAVWNSPKPAWLAEKGPFALHKVIVSFDCGDETREAPEPPFGANMAFRKELFARYGVFRPDLGRTGNMLLSGEETEMFLRIIRGGETIMYAGDAVVYHPVAEERIRKSYFRSWYFNSGKEQARTETIPVDWIRWFGVPKYFFKLLVQLGLKSWFTFDVKRRFFHELQVYKLLGRMSECRRLHKSSRSGAFVSDRVPAEACAPMLKPVAAGEESLQPSGSKR
jgi:glycosyltransferase involved in cell wall biosynthesis